MFQDIAPSLIDRVVGRGRSIFILDQYGYTDVPFNLIQTISSTLKKPEVILTFGYDWLANFVQDYARLSKMLISIGVGPINRNEYDALRGTHRGVGLMIQRHLHKAFFRIAPYFTPFFITSRESNTAYLLLHLSSHPRARDVMAGMHW